MLVTPMDTEVLVAIVMQTQVNDQSQIIAQCSMLPRYQSYLL